MILFHKQNRLHMIWGNHDIVCQDSKYVEKQLSPFFDAEIGKDVVLFCNLKYDENVVLKHSKLNKSYF